MNGPAYARTPRIVTFNDGWMQNLERVQWTALWRVGRSQASINDWLILKLLKWNSRYYKVDYLLHGNRQNFTGNIGIKQKYIPSIILENNTRWLFIGFRPWTVTLIHSIMVKSRCAVTCLWNTKRNQHGEWNLMNEIYIFSCNTQIWQCWHFCIALVWKKY